MENNIEAIVESLKQQLIEIEGWESVQRTLNITSPNNNEETGYDEIDYDKWHEGNKRFFEENKDVLMEMMK